MKKFFLKAALILFSGAVLFAQKAEKNSEQIAVSEAALESASNETSESGAAADAEEKSKKSVVNFFTPGMNWILRGETGFASENDWVIREQFMSLSLDLDMKELAGGIGICHEPNNDHFTMNLRYAPTFGNHFSVGLEETVHILTYTNVFTHFDLISALYFKYDTNKWFDVSAKFGYFLKTSRIFPIENNLPTLYNHNMAMQLKFNFKITKYANAWFEFDSYRRYKYNLWFAPSFVFGAKANPTSKLSLGAELEFAYIDIFTLSGYLDTIYTHAFVEYKF